MQNDIFLNLEMERSSVKILHLILYQGSEIEWKTKSYHYKVLILNSVHDSAHPSAFLSSYDR